MKKTFNNDVKRALLTAAKPETIRSSWQKSSLTRCLSDELFVQAAKDPSIQKHAQWTPLPDQVEKVDKAVAATQVITHHDAS